MRKLGLSEETWVSPMQQVIALPHLGVEALTGA